MMLARSEHDTDVSACLSSNSGPEDLYHLCGSMEQVENASDERNILTQYFTYLEQVSGAGDCHPSVMQVLRAGVTEDSHKRHANNTLNRRHR
jgi:hypothetical protein